MSSMLQASTSASWKSSNDVNANSPTIKVLVCTANMGNEAPDMESMREWIPNDGETKTVLQNQPYPLRATCERSEDQCSAEKLDNENNGAVNSNNDNFHIIAVGMQEATFDLPGKGSSNSEQKEKEEGQEDDTHFLHELLSKLLPSYTRVVSYQRGQMRLMIFYDKDEISLNVLSIKAQNTGKGGRANKGGIVAECDVNSGTRISFLTAHLEAHEGLEKYHTRCSTLSDIFGGTVSQLANSYCDVSMTSHFTFAMGDLNFRTRLPNYEIGSDEHLKAAHVLAENKDWDTLNEHDELVLALRDKECLVGFLTPTCDFPPTFKIERKDGYSYKSNRSPSYTDRILYKANHHLSEMINVMAYGPIDNFTTSDHKPVRGAFKIQLNQRLRSDSLLTKIGKEIETLPKTETLQFSCSSIGCVIAQGSLSNSLQNSSLCVSFISTPSDAIIPEDSSTNIVMDLFTMKWPHTQPISNTLHPEWEGEVKFKIQAPGILCGAAVDLTGAMLHILVHDTQDNLNLIGSCSLNLASLIIDSIGKEEQMELFEEVLMKNGKEVGSIKLNIATSWLSKSLFCCFST